MSATPANAITGHRDVTAARERLLRAIETTPQPAARDALVLALDALNTDPTLALIPKGARRLDLLAELIRQLRPITRQATLAREHDRILADTSLTGTERATATNRLGRINPAAVEEENRLQSRLTEEAAALTDARRVDWQDPAHLASIARRLLPPQRAVNQIADDLRRAVGAAALVAPDDPAVRRLLNLADAIEQPA